MTEAIDRKRWASRRPHSGPEQRPRASNDKPQDGRTVPGNSATADGTAVGGHILEAHIWPTLELIVVESPQHLQRQHDEETGLALISLQE